MRILVVGASGRTGRLIVEQALGHGHEVRAFIHRTPLAVTHPRLTCMTGDITVFDQVEAAVTACDAVAFTVGSDAVRGVRVRTDGVANVLHAMAANHVDRLVTVSAAGAFARTDPRLSIGFRLLIATSLRSAYDDIEGMEQRVAASGVDWTIVRPVGLADTPQSGEYRVSRDGAILPKAARVSRADVAALVLKAIETDAFSRRTVLIAG